MSVKLLALVPFLLASLAFAPSVLANGGGPSGVWTAVDCASWWEENPDGTHDMDCELWGDGSVMGLVISSGSAPLVVYRDSYATVCATNGAPSTQFVAVGGGTYTDDGIEVAFERAGCAAFQLDGVADGLYYDPGSDTLWSDPDGDGWGTIWYRV